jgi:GntR family transcriptional regulator
MIIDRRSHLPLYVQLKDKLLENIRKGTWGQGEQLPTEEEIQKEFNISRTTVRQALRELELEGLIERQAGRGTFVSQPKIQEGTQAFNLDVLEMGEQGLHLVWKIISAGEQVAPEDVARMLGVADGEPVFCLERLRLANDEVIGHVLSYISPAFVSQIDLSLADKGGTMNYLTPIGMECCTVSRVVEALVPNRQEMRLMNMDRCSPVLVITRLVRTNENQPVEYFRGVYRGDRFRYHIQDLAPQV